MKEVSTMKEKKFSKRLYIIAILSISILFSLLTVQNEAVTQTNQTKNKTTNTSSNRTSNTKINSNQSNTTTSSSSSTNLNDLGIKPYDFTGFKPDVTSYEVEVPENTKTVEVYAEAQNKNAKISGIGDRELVKGENKLDIVVTAQDGTKKTYTIHVIRGKKGTNTSEETGEGLAQLQINQNLKLTPEFKTNVYEYKLKYIGADTKLNIETKPTSDNYVVEVTGNEDLQEGENIITILVSKANGDNVATYQVTINKSLIDEEAIAKEEIAKRKQKQKIIMIIVGIVVIAAFILGIIKYRKKREKEKEFSREYFYGSNNELDDEEAEEIPRALKEEDSNKKEFEEEDKEKLEKEKIKEEFLKNFENKQENEDGKQKGKRFK